MCMPSGTRQASTHTRQLPVFFSPGSRGSGRRVGGAEGGPVDAEAADDMGAEGDAARGHRALAGVEEVQGDLLAPADVRTGQVLRADQQARGGTGSGREGGRGRLGRGGAVSRGVRRVARVVGGAGWAGVFRRGRGAGRSRGRVAAPAAGVLRGRGGRGGRGAGGASGAVVGVAGVRAGARSRPRARYASPSPSRGVSSTPAVRRYGLRRRPFVRGTCRAHRGIALLGRAPAAGEQNSQAQQGRRGGGNSRRPSHRASVADEPSGVQMAYGVPWACRTAVFSCPPSGARSRPPGGPDLSRR